VATWRRHARALADPVLANSACGSPPNPSTWSLRAPFSRAAPLGCNRYGSLTFSPTKVSSSAHDDAPRAGEALGEARRRLNAI
jgi:hypothetical protein